MTDLPPPPPGNLPPPPPPPGGYPPPPPPQGGGYPPPPPQGGLGYAHAPQGLGTALPQEAFTPWLTRVWAWLIDYIPVLILSAISGVVLGTMQKVETVCVTDDSEFQLGDFCATGNNGPSTVAWIVAAVCWLAALAYGIWNYGYRQGTTGSTIGKSIMKFKVVGESTGQPIGFGMSVVREICYGVASAICGVVWLVAVLFPLWDPRRQSLADKIVKSVCVPI